MPVIADQTDASKDEPDSLTDVVSGIEEVADENDEVCLGDALDTFGNRSFAPLLIIIPLVELSPLGGIPGFPTLLAVLLASIALQMLWGREHVWIPDFIEKRSMDGEKLSKTAHKLDSIADWVDNHVGKRLDWLLEKGGQRMAAIVILLLCLSVPPLELLPFASSIPMIAIAAIGLALLVRDGLLLLIATMLGGGSIIFALFSLIGGGGGSGG